MKRHITGLYAIVDTGSLDPHCLLDHTEQALRGGTKVIQYRYKNIHHAQIQQTAHALRMLTQPYEALLIINDNPTLAQRVHADGVHLGRDDTPIAEARALLGKHAIIGTSCYQSLALAHQCAAAGADYIAFGAMYPSSTKPQAEGAAHSLLTQAKQQLDIPVVAIGGITLDNARPLLESGADALAVIRGLWQTPDIEHTARRFCQLFEHST
jgi:thiamine-phosphate pyrophosphorylase